MMTTQSNPVKQIKTGSPAVKMVLADTCDRCGPAVVAGVNVILKSGGNLTFCYHCYTGSKKSLEPLVAAVITSEI